jgi:hypothetical protein
MAAQHIVARVSYRNTAGMSRLEQAYFGWVTPRQSHSSGLIAAQAPAQGAVIAPLVNIK